MCKPPGKKTAGLSWPAEVIADRPVHKMDTATVSYEHKTSSGCSARTTKMWPQVNVKGGCKQSGSIMAESEMKGEIALLWCVFTDVYF